MKKIGWLTGGALLTIIAFGSCRKDPLNNLTNDESRIYISNYDTTVNFSSYKTFSITDSVDVIQDNQLAGREKSTFDSTVIDAVGKTLQQRGYQQVSRESSPDLAVNVSRVYNTSTGIFSYGDYWDYYGGYWDPYYWGYPGYGFYPPYYAVGVYSITSGGLEIDVLDLKNAAAHGNKITAIWTGLARGEQVFHTVNAASEVQALFDQSAYFKH
ncbi:MAG: DUF4136 domain-containing protein [Chitinophagaceae bacterium]|nr:DUF4136 domain-containing protein [Chitinophagaceae bacterium]